MPDTVKVLVGTKKAAFIYTSDTKREKWQLSDPIYTGWSVYHLAADTRAATPKLYAAANHWAWGPSVAKSDDMGKTWDYRSTGLRFPEGSGKSVQNIWHVAPGHEREPGVVYAGSQPAALFRSEDWGHNWQLVEELSNHPTAKDWTMSGGGDSCLHSVQTDPRDPQHVLVAIATGGSYRTRDGGKTWSMFSHTAKVASKMGIAFTTELQKMFPNEAADRTGDIDPLAVNEMHKLRLHPKDPNRLWTQAHVGVFRSDDNGESWDDVTEGLPSFHGFPIASLESDPDTAFVVPLAFAGINDNFRVCDGQFSVYRTGDRGKSWQPMTKGLPGGGDYQSVYREGLDTDGLASEGVYVGTSNGALYASRDAGDSWQRLPGTLPPILSVTAAVV